MFSFIFSALAHRTRERYRVFAEPRLTTRGDNTAIPRLVPTLWRTLRNHWRAWRTVASPKQQK
jgi:hypothetical protein